MTSLSARIRCLLGSLFILALAAAIFVLSGLYNVGADIPHLSATHTVLETLRDRSIDSRSRRIEPPDLSDSARIEQGSGNYNAMCTGCHLAPGMSATELQKGLYPTPPDLTRTMVDPARAFWVVKHGIKASGMPAWGKSMADEYIWNMVAFLQKLPSLDAAGYEAIVARSGGHNHGGGESGEQAHEHGESAEAEGGGDGHSHSHASEAKGDTSEKKDGHSHSHGDATEGDESLHAQSELDVPVDTQAAVLQVDLFSSGLKAADLMSIESILDANVLILESGGAERSRDEYLSHHAISDAAFLKDAEIHMLRRSARRIGDTVWVGSESEIHAQSEGKPLTLLSAETMVLKQEAGAWKIVHIHWSSRPKS